MRSDLNAADRGRSFSPAVVSAAVSTSIKAYLRQASNTPVRIYDDPQNRFAVWPLPAIVDLRGNWVGDIPVFGDGFPDKSPTLGEAADALLCIAHSRQEMTVLSVPRSELEGTAYARELDRRLMIINGRHLVLPEKAEEQLEPYVRRTYHDRVQTASALHDS